MTIPKIFKLLIQQKSENQTQLKFQLYINSGNVILFKKQK